MVEPASGQAVPRIASHFDGFEGVYATGWAYRENDERACRITITDQDGQELARGEASRDRPDLAPLGIGRGNFAFRIPVPGLGSALSVHVYADGVELSGSPLPVGAGRFDGHLYVHDGFAVGWVTERLPEFSPPQIELAGTDGQVIASGTSLREESGEPGFVPARFRIPLTALFGTRNLLLTALADGVAFARANCTLRLVSHLDAVTPEQVAGWMYSPDAPSGRFAVEIRRDGELVSTAECAIVRDDVRSAHPGSNAVGFDTRLPPRTGSEDRMCEISLRMAGSAKELFGGPFVVGSRAAAIAGARRIAQSVHSMASEQSVAERSLLQDALAAFISSRRKGSNGYATPKFAHMPPPARHRLAIIIPVYRDLRLTRACLQSVFQYRNAETDVVLLINDASPELGMATMLADYAEEPNVLILENETNVGFVKTVNRALASVSEGDVVLLNSDTEVFAGVFDELYRVAHSAPEIGTVTPLSNNATIFSYPHASLKRSELSDISWRRLSQVARDRNANVVIDVPTAHGFCMLIRREVLQRIGNFDEVFGRGYGEENDFCARAADLGFRNVATGSAFVYHHESISFAAEKAELLSKNLATIAGRYPEYIPAVMAFEREDRMRSARWPLDRARLAAAHERGEHFTLVITNWLEGGTAEAIRDIAEACAPESGPQLLLRCRADGFIELTCEAPLLRAGFSPAEMQPLFETLSAAQPSLVAVHQVLGYDVRFVQALAAWLPGRHSVFHVHDHYAICPRVTMIDSTGNYCAKPPPDVCDRCIDLGGGHEASRLKTGTIEEHYRTMKLLLWRVTHVLAPSASAARYLNRVYGKLAVEVVEHPETHRQYPASPREGNDDEILVLGAIGAHKGSQKLLEIARLARLRRPQLRFRLIGYSDCDEALRETGNVQISGQYKPADLPALIAQCRGRLALFLHGWPETYSYTLSEAVSHGFIPLVPDIGAPAERVRETGFGTVFPFPIQAEAVIATIADIASGSREPFTAGASPLLWRRAPDSVARLRELLGVAAAPEEARVA